MTKQEKQVQRVLIELSRKAENIRRRQREIEKHNPNLPVRLCDIKLPIYLERSE